MEELKKLPPLKKNLSSSYKMIITDKVERMIRFICEKVWNVEWSGVLFYEVDGNFEDNSLVVTCRDIFLMDTGSSGYTEFDMSPDVVTYMTKKPELLDCKMGLIHSHNNMSTFFSGTDQNTLREEGNDRNHFVSLIVNNEGKYTAAITRKVKYKATRSLSYEGFYGPVSCDDMEETEGEEIEWFNLDIEFESKPNPDLIEITDRLAEIKDSKSMKDYRSWESNDNIYHPNESTGFERWNTKLDAPSVTKAYQSTYKEPTLFDDLYSQKNNIPNVMLAPKEPKEEAKIAGTYTKEATEAVTDKMVVEIVNQLISGSVSITKLDKEVKEKLIKSMVSRFDDRFGKDDSGMTLFEYWASDFIEFLMWFTVTDPDVDEVEVAFELCNRTIDALEKLPANKYINKYIELILNYANRI